MTTRRDAMTTRHSDPQGNGALPLTPDGGPPRRRRSPLGPNLLVVAAVGMLMTAALSTRTAGPDESGSGEHHASSTSTDCTPIQQLRGDLTGLTGLREPLATFARSVADRDPDAVLLVRIDRGVTNWAVPLADGVHPCLRSGCAGGGTWWAEVVDQAGRAVALWEEAQLRLGADPDGVPATLDALSGSLDDLGQRLDDLEQHGCAVS